MKKFGVLLLLAVLSLQLAACGKEAATETVDSKQDTKQETTVTKEPAAGDEKVTAKDEMVISIPVDPVNLDGNKAGSISQSAILTMVLQPLTKTDINDGYTPLPCLAESWELKDDLSGITFTIRDDVVFHNGEKMTIEDVVYSFNTLAANGARSSTYSYLDFAGVKAIDDRHLFIPFNEYNVNYFTAIGSVNIYCKEYMEANGADASIYTDKVIGTGPYTMKEWINGDEVVLEKFDSYWGDPAKIQTLTYRIMPEKSVSVMEAETGGVDVVLEADYNDAMKYADGSSGLKVHNSKGVHINYLGFNLADETMNNFKLRQAIAYAIDRDAITVGAFNGSGYTAMSLFPETVDGVRKMDTYPISQDVEKAKQLLAEAGYPDGLTLTVVMANDNSRRLMAEQLNNMLGEIGITLDIQSMETAAFNELTQKTKQGYQLYLDRMGGIGPMLHQSVTYTINKATHMDEFPTEGYDKLLSLVEMYSQEDNSEKRAEYVDQITEQFFTEWLFWIPVNHREDYTILNESLQGFEKISGWINLDECYFN